MDIKTETKTLKALNKIFNEATEPKYELLAEDPNREVAIMDTPNVVMAIAKTKEAKRLLLRFVEDEEDLQKEPTLNYEDRDHNSAVCSFSIDYLYKVLAVLKACDSETVKLKMCSDYPITAENEHFKFILAPRCCED